MNAIIVLVSCVAALGTVVCPDASPFVVGGRPAKPGEVPWMVSLSSDKSNGKHFCGGSILDSTHILTAAHCVYGIDPKKDHLKARVGSLDLDNGGSQYDVSKVTPHDYYYYKTNYDMAVLCLDTPMTLDTGTPVLISAVKFPDGEDLAPGTTVLVAGWGYDIATGTTMSDKLQVVEIPIVDLDECQSSYPQNYIYYDQLCAGADGKGACIGDAGGPLTKDGVQYGITSFGSYPCAYAPGVYTSVNYYRDWIEEHSKGKCFDVVVF